MFLSYVFRSQQSFVIFVCDKSCSTKYIFIEIAQKRNFLGKLISIKLMEHSHAFSDNNFWAVDLTYLQMPKTILPKQIQKIIIQIKNFDLNTKLKENLRGT